MTRWRWALCGLALCGIARAADVEVVREGAEKNRVDISSLRTEGPTGELFLRTLEINLARSGAFVVQRGGAVLLVEGSFRDDGGRVEARCALRNVSTGRAYFTRTYRAAEGDARTPARALADDIVEAMTDQVGIASTRIALIGSARGVKNLFVCDADGANLVQITRDSSVALAPDWFPDGQRLVYTSFHRGYPDVYRIDLRKNARVRIAAFPGINVSGAISPDGREMAVILSKDGNPELYVMNLESGALRRLTRTPHAVEASPSWSPDGRQIVFVSDRPGRPHLYVTDARRDTARRLTYQGAENVAPDWGPNGLIAYSSRREGRYRLFAIDPATGVKRSLIEEPGDWEEPSWAPNGRHIACTRRVGYRSGIYVVDTEGDPPVRLVAREGDWYSPVWSRRKKGERQ